MSKNNDTSAIVDGVLKFLVFTGAVSATIIAPNVIQAFDKPIDRYLNKLDRRARERELKRVVRYMNQQGLVEGNYEHGLIVTAAGKKRADSAAISTLRIESPGRWDRKWRIVMFDIPEKGKTERDAFTHRLKEMGFSQLQRSVWVHPFACRKEIEIIAVHYAIDEYVTYIETSHIDREEKLIDRFPFM